MARVHTQKARTDIYATGLKTPANNKQGFSRDRSKPSGSDDRVVIQKGQTYYSWQLHRQPRQISLTRPKPQQLTQSGFLITVYDIQDRISNVRSCSDVEDAASEVDGIKDDVQNLLDETQNSLDNMPESLQQGPTGELLQERIDGLEEVLSELENIDFDCEEDEEDEENNQDLQDEAVQRIADDLDNISFNF